jgi:hypothetical protein
MPTNNGWSRDERIEPNSAMRLLEQKIHYLMTICANQGVMLDYNGAGINLPDDINFDGNDFGSGAPKG